MTQIQNMVFKNRTAYIIEEHINNPKLGATGIWVIHNTDGNKITQIISNGLMGWNAGRGQGFGTTSSL